MSMRFSIFGLSTAVLAITVSSGVAQAQNSEWTRALQPELELTSHLSDRLNIRFGITAERETAETDRGPMFTLGEESMQFSALVDYSLHSSGLRMTGGALYGENWLTEDPLDMPSLSSEDMRTYVGVGWDNDFGTDGRFGLSLDMGLTFEGVADTASTPDGESVSLANDAPLDNTFENFRYTPSFSAGVEYRF